MARSNLIYGRNPILEALRSEKAIDKIFIQQKLSGDEIAEIVGLARARSVPVQKVPAEKLQRLTFKGGQKINHQGVAAFLSLIRYYEIEDIVQQCYDQGVNPLVVVLDGVTDVRNFGAIARSAECFGAHAIVVPARGSAQINPEAMKASAGALNRVPVCRVPQIENAYETLRLNGLQIYASSLQGDSDISDCDFTVPAAIVMGAEESGIGSGTIRVADKLFSIPMLGETDSLNVSVAAGVILYEVNRQRASAVG